MSDAAELPVPPAVDLDLRRLRYFVTVAERLSFVRAAAELHLTQPALSRQIRTLEAELGVTLFRRDRQGTALTDAGAQLLDDARPILASAAAVQRRVRVVWRGERRFTIGFMPGVPVTPLIRAFSALTPHLVLDVVHTAIADQADFVLDGRVDVAFVREPVASELLELVPLFPEPRVAALAAEHPLADAPSISIGQLADLPLLQDPDDVPEWRPGAGFHDLREAHGHLRHRPTTIEESLEGAASGAGFAVLPAGMAAFYRRPDVAYVALDDVAPRMVALAHGKHRTMPELDQFARLAREMLGSPAEAPG